MDRLNLIVIALGFVLTIIGSTVSGILFNWMYCLLYISLYFVGVGFLMLSLKLISNRFLRNGHFVLAVFCRSENNRHYLKYNVELRPGFLA